jgi:[acyl-carrier-protein] S-malonyltransferase
MQEAVPVGKGKMIAVLGSKIKEVNNLIKQVNIKDACEIANDNAEGQTIISGDSESVNLLQNILKDNKIKFIPLNVSAPFHCSLMSSAAQKMKDKINSTNFSKPSFDIVCNVTSKPENNPENIKNLLIEQICSTVRWRESIINMYNENVTNFIEIGPGKVLSGMVKRTVKNINCFSINSIDDMKKTINELKK